MKNHLFFYIFVSTLGISSCHSINKAMLLYVSETTCQEMIRLLPSTIINNGEGEISYDVELVAYMKSLWPCIEGKSKEAVIELFGKPAGNNQGQDSTFVTFDFSYDSKERCYNPRKICRTLYFSVDNTSLVVNNYRIFALY